VKLLPENAQIHRHSSCPGQAIQQAASRLGRSRKAGNYRKTGNVQCQIKILGPTNRRVHRLQQEGSAEAEQEAQQQAKADLQGRGGEHWCVWGVGQVDDINVPCLDFLCHPGFLILLTHLVAG